jgi:hypothetical protein
VVLLFTYFEGFLDGGSWLLDPCYDVDLFSSQGRTRHVFFCSIFNHVVFQENDRDGIT